MICTKASRFLQRPQTVKHPGYYRHQSYFARHALSGFHLNESNLALLKVFGVEESQLLASAVKHDLLASGISSPAPGTARFTAPTGPFTKTGPLKGLESSYNLAGFTSTQLSQASKVSASCSLGVPSVGWRPHTLQILGLSREGPAPRSAPVG